MDMLPHRSRQDSSFKIIIIKCCFRGFLEVTEKFFIARARRVKLVWCSFLMEWASHGKVPVMEQHPVMCEVSQKCGKLQPLVPVTSPFLRHQVFCFLNTEGWKVGPEVVSAAITLLGGSVVSREEMERMASGVFGLSVTAMRGKLVYKYSWIIKMVVAGRPLPSEGFQLQTEDEEEMCSQVWIAI